MSTPGYLPYSVHKSRQLGLVSFSVPCSLVPPNASPEVQISTDSTDKNTTFIKLGVWRQEQKLNSSDMAGERYSPLLLFLFEVREKLLAIAMGGIAQKGLLLLV